MLVYYVLYLLSSMSSIDKNERRYNMRKNLKDLRNGGGYYDHVRGGVSIYFKDNDEDTNDTWDDDHVTYGREY